ncbi:MAG: ATP synthase subunit I [Methylophilaceae bacterium]|nr:ATP synthase subunit I [Methylococcaceae bacterium]MDZ4097570.1 ATP synthase subunit I [Methylophilaceae bacterium]
MINEILLGLLAWLAGLLLGAIFFGGLWWTVHKSISSQRPALWLLPSLLLRMSITLAGFYFISDGHWQRLLLCLFGFLMARLTVIWLTRSFGENQTHPVQEANHAP